MKRSEVNQILSQTRHFFMQHDVHLPPFASYDLTKWQQLDKKIWQEVFDLKLGFVGWISESVIHRLRYAL